MTTTLRELQRRFAELGANGLAQAMTRALAEQALDVEAEAKELATTRLRVRGGALRRSIATEVRGPVLALRAGEAGGQPVRYARIQEFGGTVRPKNAQFLAQPVGEALTAAGVARFESPRSVPGLYFTEWNGKVLGIVPGEGVFYVLHREVTIKETRYLRDPMKALVARLPAPLADAASLAISGAS